MIENALLIAVKMPHDRLDTVQDSLDELKELSVTAGATVADTIIQQRKEIDSKYYIGKGKVDEVLQHYKKIHPIELVIMNHELSPTQIRNLEQAWGMKVITRTELILDIFAIHARSSSAKLQVEMAQLIYQYSRMTGKGASLSRLGGGIGTRGPGEQQLEMDRRVIQRKLHLIKKKLEIISHEREEQRKRRVETQKKVAIVGYTNSGKSTLLKRLTKAEVLIEDKLFATLDTTTRKLWIGDVPEKPLNIVITDTVGFIQDIPHGLIESFQSTLEDIHQADLLLHVMDISSKNWKKKKTVVEDTILEIGAQGIPSLLCFNKTDLFTPEELLHRKLEFPEAIYLSALDNTGIDWLKKRIAEHFQGEAI